MDHGKTNANKNDVLRCAAQARQLPKQSLNFKPECKA
jgi:hypothetical protein